MQRCISRIFWSHAVLYAIYDAENDKGPAKRSGALLYKPQMLPCLRKKRGISATGRHAQVTIARGARVAEMGQQVAAVATMILLACDPPDR